MPGPRLVRGANHSGLAMTRRDRWGRYLVVPPAGGKPIGYTRTTTIAKVLDDQSNLMSWACRMTALGLAGRPDLLTAVSACDRDDRDTLNVLVDRAKEAGGATVRRDQGTSLHAILERHWRDPSWPVPTLHAADVSAVDKALTEANLSVVADMHEMMIVRDDINVAGTFDLLVTDGTTTFIADLKTGASVSYGALAWAIQLYVYASADCIYVQGAADDGSEDERLPMPAVSQEQGVIVHVQPGSGTADIHALDLTDADLFLDAALTTREMRKQGKKLLTPFNDLAGAPSPSPWEREAPANPAEPTASPERRAWLTDRIRAIVADAVAGQMLADLWPADVPTLKASDRHTDADIDAIVAVCQDVERARQLPFPEPDPKDQNDSDVRMALQKELQAQIETLPADLRANVRRLMQQFGYPPLNSHRMTDAQVNDVNEWVEEAVSVLVDRRRRIAICDADLTELVSSHQAGEIIMSFDESGQGVTHLEAFTLALACGWLMTTADGATIVASGAGDLLEMAYGNKTAARTTARKLATIHRLDEPKTFNDILDDPMLVALLAAYLETNQPEKETMK